MRSRGSGGTRPNLDWPVLSYALSFDLNQLGGGTGSGGSDGSEEGNHPLSSFSAPPTILTVCKTSPPKYCTTTTRTPTVSSTSSVTVSQHLAHRRTVTNPLEHRRGVNDILNTVSWAVQLSRRSRRYGCGGCNDGDIGTPVL